MAWLAGIRQRQRARISSIKEESAGPEKHRGRVLFILTQTRRHSSRSQQRQLSKRAAMVGFLRWSLAGSDGRQDGLDDIRHDYARSHLLADFALVGE